MEISAKSCQQRKQYRHSACTCPIYFSLHTPSSNQGDNGLWKSWGEWIRRGIVQWGSPPLPRFPRLRLFSLGSEQGASGAAPVPSWTYAEGDWSSRAKPPTHSLDQGPWCGVWVGGQGAAAPNPVMEGTGATIQALVPCPRADIPGLRMGGGFWLIALLPTTPLRPDQKGSMQVVFLARVDTWKIFLPPGECLFTCSFYQERGDYHSGNVVFVHGLLHH